MNSRRTFLKKSSALAASLGLSHLIAEELIAAPDVKQTRPAASDRVNLGVIGCGMQGPPNIRGALQNDFVHCLGMCDVDKTRLETQMGNLKKDFPNQTSQMQAYTDFRKMLENKDIDAIIIAVPDHWHAYIFSETLKSGKGAWIEKPVANSIAECNKMVELQNRYKRVVTCGLWQVSQPYFIQAFDILKTGVLGDVFKVHTFLCQSTNPRAAFPNEEPVPDTIDYEMWLGPAPSRPYTSGRVRAWRGFWDYGGGQQTDWGVHWLDSAFDGLKILGLHDGKTYPKSVASNAYKHPNSSNETPSCQTTIYGFENFHVEWAQQVAHLYGVDQGVAWIGSNATLVCNREGVQLIPVRGRDGNLTTGPLETVPRRYLDGIPAHAKNWVECIRANNIETKSPVEKGVFATNLAQMGNIAFRTGTQIRYDAGTKKFVNNAAADAYLRPAYRKPWDSLWS